MSLALNFERKCRTCGTDILELTCGIPIFGSGLQLDHKIHRYLGLNVSSLEWKDEENEAIANCAIGKAHFLCHLHSLAVAVGFAIVCMYDLLGSAAGERKRERIMPNPHSVERALGGVVVVLVWVALIQNTSHIVSRFHIIIREEKS